MKASIIACTLALCALGSATPLEARAVTKTVTETDVVTRYKTRTETETDILTKTKYRTVTETDTLVKTKLTTITSSTTITKTIPTTTTTTVVSTAPAKTSTVLKPTTITVTAPPATSTVLKPTTIISTSTAPPKTSTLIQPTTLTVPITRFSTIVSNAPASTVTKAITSPITQLVTVFSTASAKTVTIQGKGTTVTGPGSTSVSTVTNTVSQPASTITETKSVQGPAVTSVQTVYASSYANSNATVTLSKTVTEYASTCSVQDGSAASSSSSSVAAASATPTPDLFMLQSSGDQSLYVSVDDTGALVLQKDTGAAVPFYVDDNGQVHSWRSSSEVLLDYYVPDSSTADNKVYLSSPNDSSYSITCSHTGRSNGDYLGDCEASGPPNGNPVVYGFGTCPGEGYYVYMIPNNSNVKCWDGGYAFAGFYLVTYSAD